MKMLVRAALLLSAVSAVPAWAQVAVYNSSSPTLAAGDKIDLQVDSSGNLKTTITGGGDASAANQTAVQAPVTPATATATKTQMLGGEYRTTTPTFTNTQQGAVQLGSRGSVNVQLKVADGASSISSTSTGADDTTNGYVALRTEAYGMVFDGTTWDRQRGTSADGTLVYGTTLAQDASVDGLETDTGAISTNTGNLYTAFGAQADAAATSGAASFMSYTRAIRDALYDTTTASPIKISQSTTENDVDANIGINAPVRIVSAAGVTEDETQVCAAACYVLRISGYNAAASTRYIKFTNLTAANTTPGTSTVYWSIPIPATSPFSIPVEQYFSTAATVYLVTGSADNDVAEVTAGDILGLAITTK